VVQDARRRDIVQGERTDRAGGIEIPCKFLVAGNQPDYLAAFDVDYTDRNSALRVRPKFNVDAPAMG